MQNYVFVVDTNKKRLNPIAPSRARKLLNKGKAAIWRLYPFTIILKYAVAETVLKPLTVKIDPGSKFTGIAVLEGQNVIWGAEIEHRGYQIKQALESRRSLRSSRRNRKTRYRKARFDNRKRPSCWLAPSLMHRVLVTETWIKKLMRFVPISEIVIESVKFDCHKLQNPEIKGTEYQQGTLFNYEVREYLLEKWGRECTYCGKKDVPLQIEHIHPKSKGGTNRVSNLCLACEKCNQKKGNKLIDEFLKKKPDLLRKIKKQAVKPLRDAAAVNSTRKKVVETLSQLLPVRTGTGGQTKYNRTRLSLEKQHWIDASCVGEVERLVFKTNQPLRIKCNGHGIRQMCGTNKFGFPTRHRDSKQIHFGFTTGHIVKAIVTKGKKIGTYLGRVLCRKSGSFDIATKKGRVAGISYKYCEIIHRKDGYSYSF